ncbi:hypothetical protein [uncultured Friedmanniella sp.]|uniref:hypothetical protein n=1 Tax=uncultured Friedmanniella sp. TaxID=335381 RepID=UPI0035CBFB57
MAVRPNLVEQAVELYGRWRHEGDADHAPDWSGLVAVIGRGLRQPALGSDHQQL